jgi:hypothetical protein
MRRLRVAAHVTILVASLLGLAVREAWRAARR